MVSRVSIRILIGCLLCVQMGCRIPKLFIPRPDNVLVYDTLLEQEIAGKPEPAPDDFAYDYRWRYRDSLAEPISTVSYEPETESTWDILFATNRIPISVKGSQSVQIGNRFDQHLYYGNCDVTLSHQEPEYEEPKGDDLKSKVTRILPIAWQKEIAHDESEIADVSGVQTRQKADFYERLRQQVLRSRQKDLLLFVHGFNVDFEASVTRLAQLTKDLPFNGAVVAYSWPSQGGIANYPIDGEVVNQSVPVFSTFLNELITELPAETRINIVVHSMGNRLVIRSLQHVKPVSGRKPFANIVLCAPDVGVSEFQQHGPTAVELAERVTLYTCLNDSALIASSKVNKEDRAGSTLPPTVVPGIETVECALLDTSMLGHSYYGSNHSILRDLFCIVKEHQGVEERKWLKAQRILGNEPYWIFQDFPLDIEWTWHFGKPGRTPGSSRNGIVPVSAHSSPNVSAL